MRCFCFHYSWFIFIFSPLTLIPFFPISAVVVVVAVVVTVVVVVVVIAVFTVFHLDLITIQYNTNTNIIIVALTQ